MKRNAFKILSIGMVLLTSVLAGCNKLLQETPRAIFTPEYFKTTNGVMGGLTALYAHTRNLYGNLYYMSSCECGTDESTWGQSGGSGSSFYVNDFSVPGVTPVPTNSDASMVWGNTFPYINTASGVIENGTVAGVAASLIAEARFFRAFDYFELVQTFGGVPLDLGAGRLKFNTSAVRTSKRDSVSIVYTKAIFPDLVQAVNDLPTSPRVTGALTKNVARLYLAKAYLTYGWWLENPNNIPTYPDDATRVDPDGHNAQWYFQQAYTVALTAIQNPAPYSLQPTYYDVNVATNDRNSECMLYADHTQASELYNNSSLTYGSGGGQDNFAGWTQTWNYPSITSTSSASSWKSVNSVQRIATQPYGRPWVRNAPPIEVFTQTFADKTNDSRYDGTFTSVYRCNQAEAGITAQLYNANFLPIYEGSPVLTFLNDEPSSPIDYSNSTFKSSVGAGILPGRADFVISPSGISRVVYPGIWKLGPYRTDNGNGLGNPNAASTRPFVIAKFSEFYFIAAEAAVKGATTSAGYGARDLINVIRARAGKWKFSNANNTTYIADNSANMVAATPATITIEYILAERSREYYYEGYRWKDLVRTQRWAQVAAQYTICGTAIGDHKPVTFYRSGNIQPQYYLRPIPQGQLDGMEMSDSAKRMYQNPAYR
ncbi:MAG: RagB/SusD family nutrient uptake outer membrane protein [Bacteroidota bacterium]|nr:RagB/SusD family nutrient uptake outer membrane protein [Bacteroidota bacterium]